MSELGLQKNYYLANVIAPGTVDVVFSAHTHEAVFTPLTSKSGALVVEAGDDTYVGHMDIRVAGGVVQSRTGSSSPSPAISPRIPPSRRSSTRARAPFLVADPEPRPSPATPGAQLALHQPITTVVGTTPCAADAQERARQLVQRLLHRGAAHARRDDPRHGAGLPLRLAHRHRSSSLIEGTIVADGSVTLEDAYRFFPVVYKMGTATITGGALGEVLEDAMEDVFSTSIPLQGGGWLEGFAGMRRPARPGGGPGGSGSSR